MFTVCVRVRACLLACLLVYVCACRSPQRPEEGIGCPGVGVIGSCGAPDMGTGTMNAGHAQRQCVLSTTEPSPQASHGLPNHAILYSRSTDRLGLRAHKKLLRAKCQMVQLEVSL